MSKQVSDEQIIGLLFGSLFAASLVGSLGGLLGFGFGLIFLSFLQAVGVALVTFIFCTAIAFGPIIRGAAKRTKAELEVKDE